MMADRQDQLDEVEFLQEMMSKDGEFEWSEDPSTGAISGTLSVFLQLDGPLTLRLVRKRKSDVKVRSSKSEAAKVSTGNKAHSQTVKSSDEALQRSQLSISKVSSSSPSLVNSATSKHPIASTLPGLVKVLHLPPFTLHFQFPHSYPSQDKPLFSLSCNWLNFTQLSSLCHQMDIIWEDGEGSVVLYNWQQFLANDTLSHLFGTEATSGLTLEFEDPTYPLPHWDKRAVQDMGHPMLILPILVEYDRRQKEQLFADSFFDCEICFMSLQGSKCLKGGVCGHIHCRDCLKTHVSTKIGSGNVTKIDCPNGDCKELIPPHIVKELVTVEVFERYDKLLLQRTLDSMQDIVYCPRPSCRCVTVKDDSNMVQCPRCRFCFCVLCQRAWHGVSPCKLIPSDMKELRETWESLDLESKVAMEKQYGKARLHQAFQEYDSCRWIESNAKRCPTCSANIQKTQGCNKMTCTHCHAHFCWLCDAVLPKYEPYKHFRIGMSPCAGKLFEGLQGLEENEDFWWQ